MNKLGLLCFVASLAADATGRMPCGGGYVSRARDRLRGYCASQAPAFTLQSETLFAAPALPTVESGAFLCKVNTGGTAWECVDSAGAAAGTVTQGTGTTYDATFASGVKAIHDVTGTTHPTWNLSGLGVFSGNFTVIVAAWATTATNGTFQHFGDCGNFYMRNESGVLKARYGSAGTTASFGGTGSFGWNVLTARKNGTTHTARINGANGVPASFSDDLPTGCTTFHFGTSDGATLPLRGPLAWVLFVPRHLSDTEVLAVENKWWGAPATLAGSSSPRCIDNTAVSGQVDCFNGGGVAVGAKGLRTQAPYTNKWAADPLDASSWTDVSTPVVLTNVASGPFSRWLMAPEVDSISDVSAIAMAGKASASFGTTLGGYTVSCYLAAGSSSKVRLRIDTDGTGSANCDFSDLSATYVRKTCAANVTGSPTFIKGQVLVGNAVGDTGTVLVSQCQINARSWVEEPAVNNSAIGGSFQHLAPTLPTITSKGKVEVVFTPVYDTDSQWEINTDILYLLDMGPTGGGHFIYNLLGYTGAGKAQALTSDGVTDTTITVTDVQLTPGTLTATSLEWTGNGTTCTAILKLNTCAGTVAACTATTAIGTASGQCPSQPDLVYLSQRYSDEFPSSAHLAAFRVYQ